MAGILGWKRNETPGDGKPPGIGMLILSAARPWIFTDLLQNVKKITRGF